MESASDKNKQILKLLSSREGINWRKVHHSKARLESSKRTSIILAIFSYSVFTSLQLNYYPTTCPTWIFTVLAINSALLVAMHTFAFTISTFLLPKLKAVINEYKYPRDNDVVMKPVPSFSPHDRLSGFVLLSYNVSHILGLFLFLLEIPLIAWVKLWDVSFKACVASTVIVAPAALLFGLFCWYFQRSLTIQIYHSREHLIEDVEREFVIRSEETMSNISTTPRIQECYDNPGFYNSNISMTPSIHYEDSHHSLPFFINHDSRESLVRKN